MLAFQNKRRGLLVVYTYAATRKRPPARRFGICTLLLVIFQVRLKEQWHFSQTTPLLVLPTGTTNALGATVGYFKRT